VPTLYLLCGPAFSGKTTLGRAIAEHAGLLLVSTDEINRLRGLEGGDGIPYQEWEKTHAIALDRLDGLMAAGRDLVVDDTNCFRWIRDRFRGVAERHGYASRVILLDVPRSEIRRRRRRNETTVERHRVVDEIFEDHLDTFEVPSADEAVIRFTPPEDLAAWLRAHFGGARA
jgi:predicted kinase